MGKAKRIKDDTVKDKATDSKTPADQQREIKGKVKKRLEDLVGIGSTTAAKLREYGYTFMGLATARADIVSSEMGPAVSIAKATAWIKTAQENVLSVMAPKTGKEVAKERKLKRIFYKTNSSDLNKLLGGGVASLRTTGFSGRFSTGKTQIIFNTIVDCLSRTKYTYCPLCDHIHEKEVETCDQCGREMLRKAAYIETEPDTFSDARIEEIAIASNKEIDLDNLWVFGAENIPTAKGQYLQYKIIQKLIEKEKENIGYIAVDSFTAKFRPGYSRREMLPVRTREFTEHFLIIDYLAARYNIAWALSCQVIGGVNAGQQLGTKMKTGDVFYPVGGEFLLHSMTTWCQVMQIKSEVYKAMVFDSSYLAKASCEFVLAKKGIMNGVK